MARRAWVLTPWQMIFDAFLAPWTDKKRALILAAGMFGSFGAGMQALVLNYGVASRGLAFTAPFQMFRQGLLGFIGVPLSLWLLSRAQGRWKIMGVQVLGLVILGLGLPNAFVPAVGFFLAASPFWGLYSVRYAQKQSTENRGNETALSSFLLILSAAGGLWGGGLWMAQGFDQAALMVGSLMMVVATQFLFTKQVKPLDFHVIRRSIRWRNASVRFSVFAGVLNTLMDSSMPIWFRVIGLSAVTTGGLLALRPVLTFFLTPIVGRMIQKSTLRAGILGGAALVGGWLLLFIGRGDQAFLIAPALVLLSIAANLINPAEVNRWYKRRSAEGIVAREAMLAAGRVPSFLFTPPVIYYAPDWFPIVGIALSLLFLFTLRGGGGVSPRTFFRRQ